MNMEIISQAGDLVIEIEELEAKLAPQSDAAFLDIVRIKR